MDGFSLKNGYNQLVDMIIRPPRASYDILELGDKFFRIGNNQYQRTDLELINPRGLKLQCSHYEPIEEARVKDKLPCVIYLHGNCGCRLDAYDCIQLLLPYNITLFALDLSGSGLSEGEYLSLGYYEKDDVTTIVDYLRKTERVSRIGIWGRSMGAATAIMYGSSDPSIACLILDSAFSDLYQVAKELVEHSPMKIPKSVLGFGMKIIRRTILTKAKFDIKELKPIVYVSSSFIPALFVHAEGDRFIRPHHSQTMYEKYMGDKNFIMVEGDHNTPRPLFFYDSVAIFFHNTLLAGEDFQVPEAVKSREFQQVYSATRNPPPNMSEADFEEFFLDSESFLSDWKIDMANNNLAPLEDKPSKSSKMDNVSTEKKDKEKDKDKDVHNTMESTTTTTTTITSPKITTSLVPDSPLLANASPQLDDGKRSRKKKTEKEKDKHKKKSKDKDKEKDRDRERLRPRSHSLSVPKKSSGCEEIVLSLESKGNHHRQHHKPRKMSSNNLSHPSSSPSTPLNSRLAENIPAQSPSSFIDPPL